MNELIMIAKDGKGSLLTYADHHSVHVDQDPLAYLDNLCIDHGSSLAGRTASFKALTGAVQKACVLISERSQMIYMPLLSLTNPQNVWLLYQAVVSVKKAENGCEVLFSNGTKRTFSLDPRVIRLQMKRCREFLNKINDPETF